VKMFHLEKSWKRFKDGRDTEDENKTKDLRY
jgi:hypothetical protein